MMATPVVGEDSIGIHAAWCSFHAALGIYQHLRIGRASGSSPCVALAFRSVSIFRRLKPTAKSLPNEGESQRPACTQKLPRCHANGAAENGQFEFCIAS